MRVSREWVTERLRLPVSRRCHDETVRAMLGNITSLERWLDDVRAERDRMTKLVHAPSAVITHEGWQGTRR